MQSGNAALHVLGPLIVIVIGNRPRVGQPLDNARKHTDPALDPALPSALL